MNNVRICMVLLLALLPVVVKSQQSVIKVPCNSIFGCISQVHCAADEYWTPGAALDGCCPGCVRGLGLGQTGCDSNGTACAPGLFCAKGAICALNSTSCLSTRHVSEKVLWKPQCNTRGEFIPKQCRGDRLLGRCFCYSTTGKRIFGWQWQGKADNMTCACSRRRSDLEAAGRQDVTLHCSADGNFETLQCDGGVCWCADPKTGEPWPRVPAVLPSMWQKLPCYNRTLHGEQYLRQCESEFFAQKQLEKKFALHGHVNVTHTALVCDYDGTYGVNEFERGIAYCTWRDGTRIEQYQTSSLKAHLMTCNCARDEKIFQAAGLQLELLCEGNGNYATLQDRNGELFCVDRDGFVVAERVQPETNCEEYIFG
ncbi:uncharacterized protein LOC109623117 isoform X2 [Aedes albopictus]|uniref:Thyroglobulin type-1 domain-containing protein n=1 Tax=Aedes albopictus TaxID=7160 RepID=A0ABM1XXC1_AEDAL